MSDNTAKYTGTLWFIPAVLAAGAVNGLLGAGGGVIMLYVVKAALGKSGDSEATGKDIFATVVAIMLPVSVVSAMTYAVKGNFDFEELKILILPALAGGVIGAYLTDKLPTDVIRMIFAFLVVISGIRMVW